MALSGVGSEAAATLFDLLGSGSEKRLDLAKCLEEFLVHSSRGRTRTDSLALATESIWIDLVSQLTAQQIHAPAHGLANKECDSTLNTKVK